METENQNQLLVQALKYLKQGFSIIPVRGKTCLLQSWSEYQTRKPTEEEVENWFFELNPTGIAIVTGEISGIVVLDVEKDADVLGIDIPETPTVKTGGGGRHYYFKHPGNTKLQNVIRIKPNMDFKADGGYVIAPSSQHQSGNRYEWLVGLEKTQLADIPAWLVQETSQKQTPSKDWEKILEGVPEGERHTNAVSLVGKLFRHLPIDEWKTVALPLVESWNERNDPPLAEDELMQIVKSLATKEAAEKVVRESVKNTVADATDAEEIDLTLVRLTDLLSRELPETQWTIEQLIPKGGLVVLSAPPAHHKTWLALYFAIQVAQGDLVFDRFKTKQCNVLFVEEDTGEFLIIQRLRKLSPSDKNASIQFLIRKGIKLENGRTMEKLMELIKDENIGFVIFDSLIQLHDQDENVNKDMARVFEPLKKMTDMGVSVLVLHHHRKESGNEDTMSWKDRSQSLRGASAILGVLNSHLVILRQSKDKSILRQTKLWEMPEMNPLEFEVTDEGEKVVIRCLGEKEPEKDKKTLAKEQILANLNEKHMTRGELVEALKDTASESYVASIIAELKRSKEIIVVDKTGRKGRVEVYGPPDDDPDFDDKDSKED